MTIAEWQGAPLACGLVGFGRIGKRLAGLITGAGSALELAAVLVRPEQRLAAAAVLGAERVCTALEAFLAVRQSVTVECASAETLRQCGAQVLASGSDLMPLSLAALADRDFEAALLAGAARGPGRLEIPAGAMGSIGFLVAAREDGLHAVTFRAIYPASRWRGTAAEQMVDLAGANRHHCFYRASVRDAVRLFPRHINVAVGVALAGIGLDATRCELMADPELTQATFEVEALAGPGPVRLTVAGRDAPLGADPADYTTFGVMRLLRRRASGVML